MPSRFLCAIYSVFTRGAAFDIESAQTCNNLKT
jgi:hypothetical protein